MALNKNLGQARIAKNDEFYTQLPDIEKELQYYRSHFAGKTVYCNCDDPTVSNFWRYFSLQFEALGLKKLMATCYKSQNYDLFSDHTAEQSYYLEYLGDQNDNRVPDPEEIEHRALKGDGDFASTECIEFLKEADIVVTNPPFSKFRKYVAQLIKYEKKFLIIGNMNAVTYKEIFPLIRSNQMWYGPSISSGDREFGVPDDYPLTAASHRVDEHGKKYIRVKGVRWFTNLDHHKRHEKLPLYETYSPEKYPHYDNYDAIEVSKTNEIPEDYSDAMGVPITFLDKYNPDQFEILGITDRDNNSGLKTKEYTQADVPNPSDLNRRGVIVVGGKLKSTYARILVRNKLL